MGILLNETIKPKNQCSNQVIIDLQLNEVLAHAEIPGHLNWSADKLEQYRTTDSKILHWRQGVLADFLEYPVLMQLFIELNNSMQMWKNCFMRQQTSNIRDQVNYLPVIGGFLDILFRMDRLLQETCLKSHGLKELRERINQLIKENDLINFAKRWGQLAAGVEFPCRFTLIFELDGFGNIKGVRLQGVSTERQRTRVGLFRSSGLMSVHPAQKAAFGDPPVEDESSVLYKAITSSIDEVVKATVQEALSWLRNITNELFELSDDILFFTAAYSLCSYWREKGMPFTFPAISSSADNEFIEGLYHPSLLENDLVVVTNSWLCESGNEIQLLTGANQGGKTTYLQSVGIAYWLFQLGWAIPASSASIWPVENIVTLFSSSEEKRSYNGRLSRELKELSETIHSIHPNTLVLFNEPFTSCTSVDSLNMSLELICYLKLTGVKGLWVTHLHILADQCELLNELLEQGSRLTSLVVGIEEGDDKLAYPNYKVHRVKPQHSSFARDALRRKSINWL